MKNFVSYTVTFIFLQILNLYKKKSSDNWNMPQKDHGLNINILAQISSPYKSRLKHWISELIYLWKKKWLVSPWSNIPNPEFFCSVERKKKKWVSISKGVFFSLKQTMRFSSKKMKSKDVIKTVSYTFFLMF